MSNKNNHADDLKAYLNSLNEGDNITVTCDLLNTMESALNCITESENENVFMVKFLWSTDDDQGDETELFKKQNDAIKRFNKIIKNEKNPDISWVADAFSDGVFDDGNYELDYRRGTDFMFWSVCKRNDGCCYSTVILTKEQVK